MAQFVVGKVLKCMHLCMIISHVSTFFSVGGVEGAFSPLVIVGVASPILVDGNSILYNERVEIGGYTIQ